MIDGAISTYVIAGCNIQGLKFFLNTASGGGKTLTDFVNLRGPVISPRVVCLYVTALEGRAFLATFCAFF